MGLRVLTAAILIPLSLLAIIIGGPIYSAVIAFMVIVLIFEWTRMVDGAEFSRGFYALSGTAGLAIFVAAGGQYGWALAVALVGGVGATFLEGRRQGWAPWALVGAMYLVVPAVAALFIRDAPLQGRAFTLILFATVWATDSGAYIAGKVLGGPKLWPDLSPQKTWAGALGGLALGLGTALALGMLLRVSAPIAVLLLVGVVLPIAAIVGDLLESALKRAFGVKDSGGVFPGHGGVLDRLDGFIVAVLALAAMLLIGQPDGP
ncbi:MAG: phosphatidate cytidylyltransferase [Pseudomonadota bacterium]